MVNVPFLISYQASATCVNKMQVFRGVHTGLAFAILMEQSPGRSPPFDTHGSDKHALAAYHWTPMADGE